MALKTAKPADNTAVPDTAELDGVHEGAVSRVDTSNIALGGISGETEDIRIKLPFLQIAQGQGKLDAYVKGSIIIGSDNLIAAPGEKVLITILGVQTYWREYVSGTNFDPTVIPKSFATRAEVLAAGGTTDWVNGKAPSYKVAGTIKALVKQPPNVVCGLFGVPVGDALYAPVQWSVDKTAAQETLPIIKRDASFSLRQRGLTAGVYELSTRVVKFSNGHSTWAPAIKLVSFHTDAEVEEIKSLFGGAVAAPEEAEADM